MEQEGETRGGGVTVVFRKALAAPAGLSFSFMWKPAWPKVNMESFVPSVWSHKFLIPFKLHRPCYHAASTWQSATKFVSDNSYLWAVHPS